MDLPVMPPVAPMLAKSVKEIPDVGHVEPKWDGFRTIVFRDGDAVELGSRNEKPMTRYFPELVEQTPASFVAFDVLALDDEDLTQTPFAERRRRLEAALKDAKPPVHVTPATSALAQA